MPPQAGIASRSDATPIDAALALLLELCPAALLGFDDGTTLPASRELLMMASPTLHDMLTSAQLDAGPAGGAGVIPLPGDKREDWRLALPHLYLWEPQVTWDSVEPLTQLCLKYNLRGLRPPLDRFLSAAAASVSKLRQAKVLPIPLPSGPLSITAVAHASAEGQWSVWRWPELAARCRLGATLETLCERRIPAGCAARV